MTKKLTFISFLNLLIITTLILSLWTTIGPTVVRASPAITESFTNDTAPGWILMGDAILTSGVYDPSGDGWLRLTNASNSQAGTAIYDEAFPSTNGVQVTFQYASYGGYGGTNGADGITFYLIDGATITPTVGSPGGSLGYSWDTADTPNKPGVTNGYVGIGLDEFGNFSNYGFGDCIPSCPGWSPNQIVIRGSGSLYSGFNYLTSASYNITTGSRSGTKKVRITIPPGTPLLITVEIDSGSGFQTIISDYNLSAATGQAALPDTFKMGFSGSTGGYTNYHKIRTTTVTGAYQSSTALTSTPNPSAVGEDVVLKVTITGSGDTPTGNVTFYDGNTSLGLGTLDANGVATLTTSSLAIGSHTIRAVYSGDSHYGASEDTATHDVLQQAPTAIPTSTSTPTPAPVWRFDGFTYRDDDTIPLGGVTMRLYGSNDGPAGPGDWEKTAVTDAGGYFNFHVIEPWNYRYFTLMAEAPAGLVAVEARSTNGDVVAPDTIRWTDSTPGSHRSEIIFSEPSPTATPSPTPTFTPTPTPVPNNIYLPIVLPAGN